MLAIEQMYRPITATPFQNDETYCEITPCDALKPYICCFWGTKHPIASLQNSNDSFGLVVPDTCMDIIFDVNYTKGTYSDMFCTIDENSYKTNGASSSTDFVSTFGIRFYAHTAILFSDVPFNSSKNQCFELDVFMPRLKKALTPIIEKYTSLRDRVIATERVLLNYLNTQKINCNLYNSIQYMISNRGRGTVNDVCSHVAVSKRTLERVFNENMGISPKSYFSLIRYQLLWQDMIFKKNFSVLDAVEEYGYTDQSHFLKDFKRRHLMLPKNAIEYAKTDMLSRFYNTSYENSAKMESEFLYRGEKI